MELSHQPQSATYHKSRWLCALNRAGEAMRIWQRRWCFANLVDELSAEQILDWGIEAAELNMPSLDVPTGLMPKLNSMR